MFTAPVDQMLQCQSAQYMMMDHRRPWNKPHVEIAPNCPRCASSNTKFCYYNNYSLSQPRYFCKGCRRYWTKGGSLRNVPVGGGCRKNRRGKAVRLSQADRASLSYFHNQNSSSTEDDPSGDHSSNEPGGANIDLAVVFAKFLNHNSSPSDDQDQDPDQDPNFVISGSALNHQDLSQNSSKGEDLVDAVDHLLEGLVVPDQNQAQIHQQLPGQENVENDFVGNHQHLHDEMSIYEFGLQGLLEDDDHVGQDVFWSDDAVTTSSLTSSTASFTWQPMVHLQELDYSLPSDDDQMKMPANLCGDNWSSFDFSGFEVFSRS